MELARAPGVKNKDHIPEPQTTEPPQTVEKPLTAEEKPENMKPTGEKDNTLSVSAQVTNEREPVEPHTQGHSCQKCSCGGAPQPSIELIRQIVAIVKAELLNEKVKPRK